MNDLCVDILVPVFNRENYIRKCLKNIFEQTYSNFRVIIYDDGSVDNTTEEIERFKESLPEKLNKKITLIKGKKNRGVGFARNILLENISSPFACWLDSDDLMLPERIEEQLNLLVSGNYDIVFSYMKTFSIIENNEMVFNKRITIDVTKYKKFNYNSLKYNTAFATGFFKRELKSFKFNTDLTLGGEDALWIYSLIMNEKQIGCVERVLYYYRYNCKNKISFLKRKRDKKTKEKKRRENKILFREIAKIEEEKKKEENKFLTKNPKELIMQQT